MKSKHNLFKIISFLIFCFSLNLANATGASVAATTLGLLNHQNNLKEEEKKAETQDIQTTLIAVNGGLTVDANSDHVIIRCEWIRGFKCIIEDVLIKDEKGKRREDLIFTPKEFALAHGYQQIHRITLLPFYKKTWLALEVSDYKKELDESSKFYKNKW